MWGPTVFPDASSMWFELHTQKNCTYDSNRAWRPCGAWINSVILRHDCKSCPTQNPLLGEEEVHLTSRAF